MIRSCRADTPIRRRRSPNRRPRRTEILSPKWDGTSKSPSAPRTRSMS